MIKRRLFSSYSKTRLAFNLNYYSDEQLKQDYLRQKSIERFWDSDLIKKHKYLRLPKIEPNYMLIIDNNIANELSESIVENISNETRSLIELNPGFGLVTKNLIKNNNAGSLNKFHLVESNKEYLNYLNDMKIKNKNIHLHIEKNPFNPDKFRFSPTILDELKQAPFAIYGILPWNHKIFLQSIYSYYANNMNIFGYEYLPELFLILPEFLAAQLQPELNVLNQKRFIPINSKLSVQSSIFSDCKILSIQSTHDFYPYPLASPKIKNKFKELSIDYTKMYLMHIKFLPRNKLLVNDKRLFNQFLTQIWCNSNNTMKDALKNLYFDLKPLKNPKFNLNRKIKTFHSYEFLEIFTLLNEDPSNSILKDKILVKR